MGNCLDCRAYGPREDAHTNKSGLDTAALLASSNDASKGKGDPVAVPEQVIAERPRPLVFALMRNGHEVLRGAMEDISDYLEKENKDAACAAYLEFHRWSALHKLMEDGHNDGKTPKGMFAMLDEEFDGIAQKNGLRDDHNTLDVIEDGLTAACNNKNTSLEALKALWDEYKTAYLTHLKKEEGVMMPQVVQLKNRGENLTVIMQTEILPLVEDDPDFEFFVKYANKMLHAHPGNMPRVRVFDHALWACVEPSKWAIYDQWIKESVPPERYAEVQRVINPDLSVAPGTAGDCL